MSYQLENRLYHKHLNKSVEHTLSMPKIRTPLFVTVDAVVFTVRDNELKLLLIKRKEPPFQGTYALPGGFVNEQEELEDAVKRELAEETNVKDVFLKQFGVYGNVGRDPRGRIITTAYIALISADQQHLMPATDATEARWFSIQDLPKLAFDHAEIIADALKQLRYEIQTTNIAVQILPQKFTLSELQHLYELVLGRQLDKRNFRKRIKELGILKETHETKMEGAHRPAQLYKFSHAGYTSLREKVHVFLG